MQTLIVPALLAALLTVLAPTLVLAETPATADVLRIPYEAYEAPPEAPPVADVLRTSYESACCIEAVATAASACTNASIEGTYEFVSPAVINIGPGTVVAIPDHLLYATPAADVSKGILTFDGAGVVSLQAIAVFSDPHVAPEPYAGSNTLDSGCTATALFDNGMQLGLKIVENGKISYLVSTTPAFVILPPAPMAAQMAVR